MTQKLKSYSIFVAMVIVSKTAWSQNTNLDYKSALKVYNLTTFEEESWTRRLSDSATSELQYTSKTTQILHPTIAFQWKTKKNNFHEIELTNLTLGKLNTGNTLVEDSTGNSQTLNGSNITSTFIAMRYEYILNFNKSKDSKFVPSIGFGASPYFKQNNEVPKTANFYPTSEKYIGFRGFITPRFTYYTSSKFFIDANLPICIIDANLHTDKAENPVVPVNQRKISTFDFSQFPRILSARIGIGLKL